MKIEVWTKTNGICFYCGSQTSLSNDGNTSFVADHIIPSSAGGVDDVINLAPSCKYCNNTKSGKSLEEFRSSREQKIIEKEYGVKFSFKQAKVLSKMGFEFPIERHIFWFEKEDIEIDINHLEKLAKDNLRCLQEKKNRRSYYEDAEGNF